MYYTSSKLVGWSSIVDTQKDAELNGGTKIVLKPVSSCQMSTGWSQDVTITVSFAYPMDLCAYRRFGWAMVGQFLREAPSFAKTIVLAATDAAQGFWKKMGFQDMADDLPWCTNSNSTHQWRKNVRHTPLFIHCMYPGFSTPQSLHGSRAAGNR